MVLAYYYYLTLLSLKEMAHLILWRINRTAFLVVMKETVREREQVKGCGYRTARTLSGERLQTSPCCQLLNNSLKTKNFVWLASRWVRREFKMEMSRGKPVYLLVQGSKSVNCATNFCGYSLKKHCKLTVKLKVALFSLGGKRLLASSCLSVCPHGTTRLPLDGFSWNLIFEDFFQNMSIKFKFP